MRPQLVARAGVVELNFWTRLLPTSTTSMSPATLVATPLACENSPFPLPWAPHWRRYVPVPVNFWMTLLLLSAT